MEEQIKLKRFLRLLSGNLISEDKLYDGIYLLSTNQHKISLLELELNIGKVALLKLHFFAILSKTIGMGYI